MSSKYALIKWLSGQDKGKYSPDVPTSWIRDFNDNDKDFEESYVVEWRAGRKVPPGGWPVFDGLIICTSDKISVLKKKLSDIEGMPSPRTAMSEVNYYHTFL